MDYRSLPQQDFFIYVPILKDSDYLDDPSVVTATGTDAETLPMDDEHWVPIPLSDVLVVYARLKDGQHG